MLVSIIFSIGLPIARRINSDLAVGRLRRTQFPEHLVYVFEKLFFWTKRIRLPCHKGVAGVGRTRVWVAVAGDMTRPSGTGKWSAKNLDKQSQAVSFVAPEFARTT